MRGGLLDLRSNPLATPATAADPAAARPDTTTSSPVRPVPRARATSPSGRRWQDRRRRDPPDRAPGPGRHSRPPGMCCSGSTAVSRQPARAAPHRGGLRQTAIRRGQPLPRAILRAGHSPGGLTGKELPLAFREKAGGGAGAEIERELLRAFRDGAPGLIEEELLRAFPDRAQLG